MSTNYYIKPKIIQEIQRDLENKKSNTTIDFEESVINNILNYLDSDSNWLHIGKRSGGSKPTFHKNNYWSSVEEIIDFYEKHKESVSIVDEYDTELSIEELKENLIDWNKRNNKALTPFDDSSGFNDYWRKNYYKDKDGYIFTIDNFS